MMEDDSSANEYDRNDNRDEGFQEPNDEDSKLSTQASSCQVIRKETLLAAQKDDLQRVMDFLSIKEYHARTLLIHHRWNVDNLFSVFVERGAKGLYLDAGVSFLENNNDLCSSDSLSQITCQVCFDELPGNETTTMDCGHCFCNECWIEHFIFEINAGTSRRVTCMVHNCYSICDEGKVKDLVSTRDPQLAAKFERFLLESYIDDNKMVKWCPSVPHCGNAIRVKDNEYIEVECVCGKQFCFSCSAEPHSPCSCLMLQLWQKKRQNESNTVDWFTKSCPKCSKPVTKDGGCNLVRCICGQYFCWRCGALTDWDSDEDHVCEQYRDDHEEGVEEEEEERGRYTLYYTRYKAHVDSLKDEEERLKDKLLRNIRIVELKRLEMKDYSWVTNGFDRLVRSRRILSYSYPFAYFMFGEKLFKNKMTLEEKRIKQKLFEDQQHKLEMNVKWLSGFLDEPFAGYSENIVLEMRTEIITLSEATDNLCANLYNCIDYELLGPDHRIARYRSNGVEKATELAHNA